MNGLENFPLAPPPGYVTLHEIHGEFKSCIDAEGGIQCSKEVRIATNLANRLV